MTHDFPHIERTRRGKVIRCTWCGQRIERGDKYFTFGQVHEGQMNRLNFHPECERAYLDSRGMYEFSPGEMGRGEPCDFYA